MYVLQAQCAPYSHSHVLPGQFNGQLSRHHASMPALPSQGPIALQFSPVGGLVCGSGCLRVFCGHGFAGVSDGNVSAIVVLFLAGSSHCACAPLPTIGTLCEHYEHYTVIAIMVTEWIKHHLAPMKVERSFHFKIYSMY